MLCPWPLRLQKPSLVSKALFALWPRLLLLLPVEKQPQEELLRHVSTAVRRLVQRFCASPPERLWLLQALLQGVAVDLEMDEVFLPLLFLLVVFLKHQCLCRP